jgi:prolipoprotein diacylglyceryltransferase
MYPTLSDLIQDVFGVYVPLPIQSFGFMLAISFLLAAYTLQQELKRKEKDGLLRSYLRTIIKGRSASKAEITGSFLTGFIIGYKLVYAFLNYSEFVADTQGILLTWEGSLPGGVLVGALMAWMHYRESEKQRLPEPREVTEEVHPWQMVSNLTMVAAVSGILGAKLFHNLENMDELLRDPLDALLSFSGLTMYGGLIVGAVAVMRYGYKKGIHPVVLSDATAPGLMLAYGTGRLGCQLSGDGDWGVGNDAPQPAWLSWLPDWTWAYNYPNNVIGEGIPIPGCEGRHCMMLPDAVFPTPLYEAVACILLFFLLWRLRTVLNKPGLLFSVYLVLNGTERLLIEQIRVNNRFDFLGMQVTQAEVIAVSLILAGISGWMYFKQQGPEYGKPATG